jgi:uncharacterized protein (DUF362 family)
MAPAAARQRDPPAIDLPTYGVPQTEGTMAVVHGNDRRRNLVTALKALGGMERFIRPGDRVLLKVNAAFATPPQLGATSHPDMVAAVVAACHGAGAGAVQVTDNPINDPASCFELSGIGAAARENGARVVLPAADRFAPHTLPGGRLIRRWPVLMEPLLWADKVIGLAPVKNHHRSGASMTIKNWYGLLGGRRNLFHQQIHTIITELAQMVRPTLVVLDGTWSMVRNGPTGGALEDLKPTGVLVAGTDPVAVDARGAELLELAPEALPHLAMAQAAGAGSLQVPPGGLIETNASGS